MSILFHNKSLFLKLWIYRTDSTTRINKGSKKVLISRASSAHACGRRGFHLAVLKTFSKSLSTLARHASSLNQQKCSIIDVFLQYSLSNLNTGLDLAFLKNTSIMKTLGLLNKWAVMHSSWPFYLLTILYVGCLYLNVWLIRTFLSIPSFDL